MSASHTHHARETRHTGPKTIGRLLLLQDGMVFSIVRPSLSALKSFIAVYQGRYLILLTIDIWLDSVRLMIPILANLGELNTTLMLVQCLVDQSRSIGDDCV